MANYKYHPIDLDRPGVRLLQLSRGKRGDDIHCDLFDGWISQVEQGIPYEALSYTWETTEKSAQITVNGCTMQVTSNLYSALQYLRLEAVDRVLWVDAICINQENMEERRHQVQLMNQIYKEAERVLVWLGEGTEESDLLMDFMKQLHESSVKVEGDWRRSAQLWIRPRASIGNKTPEIDKWHEAMKAMLARPWFRRIWILQEIANARVATIHCGECSVSARTFAQVPSIIGFQPDTHSQAVLDIMPGPSRKESWWAQDRNLLNLLIKFRGSKATDERDMIYALLGISLDACQSDVLPPDYTKTTQQLVQITVSFLLSYTGFDPSYYEFLPWSLSELLEKLQDIPSLSREVLGEAFDFAQQAVVEALLATDNKFDVNSRNSRGQMPLHRAVYLGYEAAVRLLLSKGRAEVDARDYNQRTPLAYAAERGQLAIVQLLLEHGAEIESRSAEGLTPISYAVGYYNDATVQLLLQHGARKQF